MLGTYCPQCDEIKYMNLKEDDTLECKECGSNPSSF